MLRESIFAAAVSAYLRFVYATSKVTIEGCFDRLSRDNPEKYIVVFWHGDNLLYFPLLKDIGIAVVTTINRRGDFISGVIRRFGYVPLRAPDVSVGGNHLQMIKETALSENRTLALTLDGPLGPYHVPKKFITVIAKLLRRGIVPIAVEAKRKINVNSRWDKYMIPLPFNRITYRISEPIQVKSVKADEVSERIAGFMDGSHST